MSNHVYCRSHLRMLVQGFGCSSPKPDCDIVAGLISQCKSNSFPYLATSNATSSENSTVSVDARILATEAPSPRAEIEKVKGWRYRGCFTDNIKNRTLVCTFWSRFFLFCTLLYSQIIFHNQRQVSARIVYLII